MKSSRRLLISVGLIYALFIVSDRVHGVQAPLLAQTVQEQTSAEYLEALQTANTFLWAWLTRDAKVGLRLISDQLRSQIRDESWLRQFMVGLSNPHHQAFEIGSGHSESSKGTYRYVFSVILYELYTGEQRGFAYTSNLEVVKQGHIWRVNRLPKTSDNP